MDFPAVVGGGEFVRGQTEKFPCTTDHWRLAVAVHTAAVVLDTSQVVECSFTPGTPGI